MNATKVLINGEFIKVDSAISSEYYLSDSGHIHVYKVDGAWVRIATDRTGMPMTTKHFRTKDAAMIGC
jgi:hypothetical protein